MDPHTCHSCGEDCDCDGATTDGLECEGCSVCQEENREHDQMWIDIIDKENE